MSSHKYQQMSQICSKRRVPQHKFVVFFRVPIPRWSPGRPRAGSKAQKHAEMEAPRWIVWYLIIIMSYFLEACWRCFVYSMNNILIILDISFYSLGEKPKVGASWVLPGCQGASRWLKIHCLGSHARFIFIHIYIYIYISLI